MVWGKRNYYYLVSGLPELCTPELAAERNLESLLGWLSDNLTEHDRINYNYLIYRNDNKNLLYLLRQREGIKESPLIDFYQPAIFSHQELEEGLAGLRRLSPYMEKFLEELTEEHGRGLHSRQRENRLITLYYDEALQLNDEFLAGYFAFKRDLKNIISGLNSRLYGYPLDDVLIGEYELLSELRENPSPDFGLRESHPYIAELSELIKNRELKRLEKFVDRQIHDYLVSRVGVERFANRALFAYAIELALGHRWLQLEVDRGREALQTHVNRVVASGEWPPELAEESWVSGGAG